MRVALLLIAALAVPVLAQNPPAPESSPPGDPWFGTFSIIAFDPATGEHGVAVQSRAFGAGAAVPYAKAGVGAVATQAAANRQYGPKAIALLEQGIPVDEVVRRITAEDPGRDRRQVAVIDAQGRTAVYTGRTVIERNHDPKDPVHFGGYAGHVSGPNYSAQGNTLASDEVVTAMAAAFENTKGSLAERLMEALEAGQAHGGDTRGMQSAGLLVVRPLPPDSDSTVERIVDIRVDDHENPFLELKRLLSMTLGVPNRLVQEAETLAGAGKIAEAIEKLHEALAINPRSETVMYALARRYAQAGDITNALEWLGTAIQRQPAVWRPRASADPLFEPLRRSKRFQRLIGG